MKKLSILAALALLGTGAFAQTSQGTVAVRGSVGFWTNKNESSNNNYSGNVSYSRGFYFGPSVGYFVTDGLELGIEPGVSHNTQKYNYQDVPENIYRSNAISIDFYGRKYLALTEQLQLHGTGYAGVGFENSKSNSYDDSSTEVRQTTTSFNLAIKPGITYFATPKLVISANIGAVGFSRSKTKPKDENMPTYTSNSFGANLSLGSAGFGIGYYIAR